MRAGLAARPEQYAWSSYPYYMGQKKEPNWLTVDFILGYFDGNTPGGRRRYGEFDQDWLGPKYESPLQDTKASTILGKEDLIRTIKEKYLTGRKPDRDLPALAEFFKASPPEIWEAAKGEWGEGNPLAKKAALYLSHRYGGRTLKEIGSHFGMGESAVSQASRRFQATLDEDRELSRRVQGLYRRLGLCNV